MSLVKCDVVFGEGAELHAPTATATFSRVPSIGEHVLLPSAEASAAGGLVSYRVVRVTHQVERAEGDVAAWIQVTAEAVAGTV
jgi:hypothetical protein